VIPPVFISSPARIKKGQARKGKESTPPTIRFGIIIRGVRCNRIRKRRELSPRANAMGVLSKISVARRRIEKRTRPPLETRPPPNRRYRRTRETIEMIPEKAMVFDLDWKSCMAKLETMRIADTGIER
jgi:hypothetical protein